MGHYRLITSNLLPSFKVSNNHVEYDTLIVGGMLLAMEMSVQSLIAKNYSYLVIGQVSSEFQAKDPHLVRYLRYV